MAFILEKAGPKKKLTILGAAARDDACASFWSEQHPPFKSRKGPLPSYLRPAIYTSLLPGGKRIKLFKILLDNRCLMDCHYCALRSSAGVRRCGFEPEELARIFMNLYQGRVVGGLFLSSAIGDKPDLVQAKMIETAEILRRHHHYRGYLHLKILPGVSEEAVYQACRWADRVSVNLEAPNQQRLQAIAPQKNLKEGAVKCLSWAAQIAKAAGKVPSGITTQFVVGAAGETDTEILQASAWLYKNLGLRRAYYSSLRPVAGTPLEDMPPPPPSREHRLYQSDWLLRNYGFKFEELTFDQAGNLPLETDPKLAWARRHPEFFPLEINEASREELLRVPGIGMLSAERIIQLRQRGGIGSLEQLKKLRLPLKRVRNFVTLSGRLYPSTDRPPPDSERQLFLDL